MLLPSPPALPNLPLSLAGSSLCALQGVAGTAPMLQVSHSPPVLYSTTTVKAGTFLRLSFSQWLWEQVILPAFSLLFYFPCLPAALHGREQGWDLLLPVCMAGVGLCSAVQAIINCCPQWGLPVPAVISTGLEVSSRELHTLHWHNCVNKVMALTMALVHGCLEANCLCNEGSTQAFVPPSLQGWLGVCLGRGLWPRECSPQLGYQAE